MSAFAVAAAYDAYLPVGASTVEAVIRINASDIGEPGVAVSLRLWTPHGATIDVLREVSSASCDLRERMIRLDDRTGEYPAGHWTDSARVYKLAVTLPARRAGEEMLAARFGVVVDGEVVGRAPIAVTWTDDERLLAASTLNAAPSTRPAAVAAADLPTGPSPQPRHTPVDEPAASGPCPSCGLHPQEGDRFCEGCGHELAGGRWP